MKLQLPSSASHSEPLFRILNPEGVCLVTRYFTWLYNALPNRLEFVFEVDPHRFIPGIKKDLGYTEATSILFKDYLEGKYSPVPDAESHILFLKEGLLMCVEKNKSVIVHNNLFSSDEIERIISALQRCKVQPKVRKKREFGMVVRGDYGGFEINKFEVSENFSNEIIDHYNDDLHDITPKLLQFVEDPKKGGLVLLHGTAGTGKTSYLRYLIQQTQTDFLYLPQDVFSNMSDPAFIPFIAKQKGSVIVLEDCEELLKPRNQSHLPMGISNLLNLADGLLGDALRLKIICTFNTELTNIDHALLRKGRLFQRYEFCPLSLDKTNHLLKKQVGDVQAVQGMTLAEIFNYELENNSAKFSEKTRKIGYQ
jgi:hypothetical protein